MYMSCTCSTIMYMLLITSLSIRLQVFITTMYMFVQNSKKKIARNLFLLIYRLFYEYTRRAWLH
jgi:hypothetical protein